MYLTFASFCDVAPYHGWVMAYDAATLKQRGVFNVSPDAAEGGIWLGDTGPAADQAGNIYVPTGNGKFDAPAGRDYGDSVLKLNLSGSKLVLADFFTPFNQRELNAEDNDIGSGGPILLPDQPGPHPHLLVVAGKGGTLYLIDRDRMGRFNTGDDSHAVQTLRFRGESYFGAPAYWNGHVFSLGSNDWPRDLVLQRGQLVLHTMAGGPRTSIREPPPPYRPTELRTVSCGSWPPKAGARPINPPCCMRTMPRISRNTCIQARKSVPAIKPAGVSGLRSRR